MLLPGTDTRVALSLKRGITYDPILFAAAWVVRRPAGFAAAKTRNTSAGFQNDYGRFIFYCATRTVCEREREDCVAATG
jgi:hypothetical protein